ncbi:MAG: DUF4238 domain-containing protein [Desulfatiglandales bacterium]
MGDHYVPQYYLKGFSQNNGKSIWVYDKVEKRKFTTQIKNVGNITNFYSEEVEQYLANTIENPANEVLKKIRERQKINENEKVTLAEYMAVMFKRVPKGKERLKELAPSICEKLYTEISDDLLQIAIDQPDKNHIARRRISEIKEILDKYSKNPPKEIWLGNIPSERSPQVVAALVKMTWMFMECNDTIGFMTSDNPLFYFTSIGVGKPESEVVFPISSNILLWATWRTDLPLRYLPTKSQLVKEMNRRIVSEATRFIFASNDAVWILPFVMKGDWKLHLIK